MPGIVRMPDVDSAGHSNSTSSPNTFVNSQRVARYGDIRPCPKKYGKNRGKHTMFVNNRYCQTCGDGVTSGHGQVQCSPNTFLDG